MIHFMNCIIVLNCLNCIVMYKKISKLYCDSLSLSHTHTPYKYGPSLSKYRSVYVYLTYQALNIVSCWSGFWACIAVVILDLPTSFCLLITWFSACPCFWFLVYGSCFGIDSFLLNKNLTCNCIRLRHMTISLYCPALSTNPQYLGL